MSSEIPDGDKQSLIEFPCEFPIKVMGRDNAAFRGAASSIVERHAAPLADDAVRSSRSRNANYVSLTITIQAVSQEQLDNIYRELSAHDDVLVVL